jgi:hypothetical protein
MRREWMTAILASAVLAAACGVHADDGGRKDAARPAVAVPAPPAAPPTACKLVSQAEMSAILGGAVGTPVPKEGSDATACNYPPANPNAVSPYAQVAIDWDAGEEAMMGNNLAAKLLGKDAGFSIAEPIEGLGDEASTMIGGVTNVRKGRTFIKITLGGQSHAKEKGTAIAKLILSRIDASAR